MRRKRKPPTIGVHLATINLFREPDGSLHLTVAGASAGAIQEARARGLVPHDYVKSLVEKAYHGMKS